MALRLPTPLGFFAGPGVGERRPGGPAGGVEARSGVGVACAATEGALPFLLGCFVPLALPLRWFVPVALPLCWFVPVALPGAGAEGTRAVGATTTSGAGHAGAAASAWAGAPSELVRPGLGGPTARPSAKGLTALAAFSSAGASRARALATTAASVPRLGGLAVVALGGGTGAAGAGAAAPPLSFLAFLAFGFSLIVRRVRFYGCDCKNQPVPFTALAW